MSLGCHGPVAETLVQSQDPGVLLCVSRVDRREALVGGPADRSQLGKPSEAAAAKAWQGAGELIRSEPRRLVDLEERERHGTLAGANDVAPLPRQLRMLERLPPPFVQANVVFRKVLRYVRRGRRVYRVQLTHSVEYGLERHEAETLGRLRRHEGIQAGGIDRGQLEHGHALGARTPKSA